MRHGGSDGPPRQAKALNKPETYMPAAAMSLQHGDFGDILRCIGLVGPFYGGHFQH